MYAASVLGGVISHRRAGVPVRDPLFIVVKLALVVAVTIVTVIICNKDRGVPFVLLLMVAHCSS